MSRYSSRPCFAQIIGFEADEPVSLETLKMHCRVDGDDEDDLLLMYLSASRARCESELNAKVRRQTVQLSFSAWGCDLRLDGLGQHVTVTDINYQNADGVLQTLPVLAYRIQKGVIFSVVNTLGSAWPALSGSSPAITVTAQAGYQTAGEVPEAIQHWILLHAASMYRSREAHSDKPMAKLDFVDGALDAYRIPIV